MTDQLSERRFRALVEHSGEAITLLAVDGTVIYESPTVPQLTGFTVQDRMGKSGFDNIYPDDLPLIKAIFTRLYSNPGSAESAQFRSVRKDGAIWWTEGTATNLLNDPEVRAIVVNYRDITERKQAEEQLHIALAEKEALLRELLHRTKNNMQVISALLTLQSESVADERLEKAFAATKNRIYAMSLAHQKLYQSQNLSSINLSEYLQELAQFLIANFTPRTPEEQRRAVELLYLGEPAIFALIDSAIPCGLIVTELVTNSLAHAFPSGSPGQISLSMKRSNEHFLIMRLADNGVGAPEGVDFRNPRTLGLTLVNLMTKQLQGEATFNSPAAPEGGLSFQITFRDNLYKPRV
jgi:PAS domain S-box-containing protein